MEEIAPDTAHRTHKGVYLLDEDHVQRLIECMRRYLPESAEPKIKLTLVDGRTYIVKTSPEVDGMPFDRAKDFKEFAIEAREPELPFRSISVTYNLVWWSNDISVWCRHIPDMQGALDSISRIITSKTAWYSTPYRYGWIFAGIFAGIAPPATGVIPEKDLLSALLNMLISFIILGALYFLHRFLFARYQIMFGAEGKRERNRQLARKWVGGVTVTLIAAWIAGGYLRKGP